MWGWCDVVWCDMMWFDVMCCDVIWCDLMWCDVMLCDVMWCNVMWGWCDAMWCAVILGWCDVMWYDLMWCEGDVMWYEDVVMWCDVIWSDVMRGWCEGDVMWYDVRVIWSDVLVQVSMLCQWYLTKLGCDIFLWYKYSCYVREIKVKLLFAVSLTWAPPYPPLPTSRWATSGWSSRCSTPLLRSSWSVPKTSSRREQCRSKVCTSWKAGF